MSAESSSSIDANAIRQHSRSSARVLARMFGTRLESAHDRRRALSDVRRRGGLPVRRRRGRHRRRRRHDPAPRDRRRAGAARAGAHAPPRGPRRDPRRRRPRHDRRDGARRSARRRARRRSSPRVARHIADGEVRRTATVGGNICARRRPRRAARRSRRAADRARRTVRSTGAGGERTEPIEDFLAGDRGGRLVLEVAYDRFDRRTGAARACVAGTPTPTRSPASSRARAPTAATCASPSPASARRRCAAARVEQSRDAGRRPAGCRAGRRRRRVRPPTAASVLPKLVREALDQLERA